METIKHSTGQEVNVQYFGNLQEKLAVCQGYVRGVNAFNAMQTKQDGILRPSLSAEDTHKTIRKQHAKFYGEDNKYDGKGNLR